MNAPAKHALFRNSVVRRATEADLPRLLLLANLKYPGRVSDRNLDWAKWKLRDANSIVVMTEHALGAAGIIFRYGSEKRAQLDMLASAPGAGVWEPYQLVKFMVRWAALQGATGAFRIDADTGVDFGPFAKRLGGWEVDPKKYPRYDIPLCGGIL